MYHILTAQAKSHAFMGGGNLAQHKYGVVDVTTMWLCVTLSNH